LINEFNNKSINIENILGTFKKFGSLGIAYEIIDILVEKNNLDRMVKIKVIETNEETEYPYEQAINDPEA
ncbi:MAG: hypothetical protein RLZZ546_1039, partial [Bacteroidota bacterium]